MSRQYWVVAAVAALVGLAVGATGTLLVMVGPAGYRRGAPAAKLVAGVNIASPSPTASRSPMPTFVPPSQPPPSRAPSPAPSSAPGATPSGANGLAFDAANGQTIAFGTTPASSSAWPAPDTWVWYGNHWSELVTTDPAPSARTGASMAYDPVRKVVILHGGYDEHYSWANDTWAWDGTRWTQLSPLNSPPADGYVRQQPMCWDGQKNEIVMVNAQGNPAGAPSPSQTWSWDGSTWSQLAAPGSPSIGTAGMQPMAMACDNARNKVVMFSPVGGVPTTWTYDGQQWTQVATSGTASGNFAMAADDANSTMAMVGSTGDTWTWDGSKWTVQHPAHSPSSGGVMAYDSVRHVVVLLGAGTWTWNGSDWTQVA